MAIYRRGVISYARRSREHGNARAGDRRRTGRRLDFLPSVEGRTDEDRERVCVRLTPQVLDKLYVEAKNLSSVALWATFHEAACSG